MSQLIPGTVQTVIRGIDPSGKKWANVYYQGISVVLTQAVADAFVEPIQDCYEALLPAQHTGFHITDAVVTDMRADGAPQFLSTAGFPLAGSNANAPLPGQVSGIITWKTAFRGKAGRGRTYLNGFTEDASAGDGPTPTVLALLVTFGNNMVATGGLVVASRFLGVAVATTGSRRKKPIPRLAGVTNIVTASLAHPTWATQRRRALRA